MRFLILLNYKGLCWCSASVGRGVRRIGARNMPPVLLRERTKKLIVQIQAVLMKLPLMEEIIAIT